MGNKIKHQHGQLRSIMFVPINKGIIAYYPDSGIWWSPPHQKIIGYYLEGVHPDGVIGTDLEIHSNNTAISLNRNLKYHFFHLYLVGIHLKNAIVQGIKKSFNVELVPLKKVTLDSEGTKEIEKVAKKISRLPQLFFPDEFNSDFPDVIYHAKDRKVILTLEYPSYNRVFWRGDYEIKGSFRLDYMNATYRLPYWKLLYYFQ